MRTRHQLLMPITLVILVAALVPDVGRADPPAGNEPKPADTADEQWDAPDTITGGPRDTEDSPPDESQAQDAAQLRAWIGESSLAAQESAKRCYSSLLENQARLRGKHRAIPDLRSRQLEVPVAPNALPGPEQLLAATVTRLRNLPEKLSVAQLRSVLRELDLALAMLEGIDTSAAESEVQIEQEAATQAVAKANNKKNKKNKKKAQATLDLIQKKAGEIAAFETALEVVREAIRADRHALSEYLALLVEIPAPNPKSLAKARHSQVKALARTHACQRVDRLCLTAEGVTLGDAFDDATLEPGFVGRVESKSRVTVLVFGEAGSVPDGDEISLKMGEIERTSDLARSTEAGLEGAQGAFEKCETLATDVGYMLIESTVLTVPDDAKVRHGIVEFERKDSEGETRARGQHPLRIEHGRYYVDVGLLVPFVPQGKREVVDVTRNGARYVGVQDRLHVTGALALNIFPGGRRKDVLSPFEDLSCDERLPTDHLKRCKRRRVGRPFAELFGLQLGVDLNAELTDQFYVGAVLEPLTGLTLSTGVAIIQRDGLSAGVREGQLVTAESDLTPRARHDALWYGGFMLSYDLVRFVQNARARFKEQQ